MNLVPAAKHGHDDYRPDIDGLRALAVCSVIAFHATPGYAPAGFFGVDIFFVISGYLITNILLRDARHGQASLWSFYGRRIRRIFPALILMLTTVLVVGWFTLVDGRYAKLGVDAAAAAGFVANLLFWNQSSYFVSSSDLLHLWSLGVEEQFYLVWPLLIHLVVKRRMSVVKTLAVITILSFGYSLYATLNAPTAAFYSPVSRCWQLSAGGLIAAARLAPGRAVREGLGLAGAAAIVTSLWLADRTSLVPGLWAVMPVFGAAAVIQALPRASINRLLSFKPAVWIGLISYPLYLWHWPALQFVISFTPYDQRNLFVKLAVLFSFAAAAATYLLVERPLRRRSPLMLLTAMAAVLLAALAICWTGGFPGRPVDRNGRALFLADYARLAETGDARSYRSECDFLEWHSLRPLRKIDSSCTAQGPRSTQFLWGDSHAQALSLGLRSIQPQGSVLAQVATSGCAPSIVQQDGWLADVGPYAQSCRRSNAFALASIDRLKPTVVYLAQAEGHDKVDWDGIASELRRRGARRVVLIGPVPQWHPSLAARVADSWPDVPSSIDGVDQGIMETDRVLRATSFQNLQYVSLVKALCRGAKCRARVGSRLMLVDYGHLTGEGSLMVARTLEPMLEAASR